MIYTKDDLSTTTPPAEGRLQKEMDSFALLDSLGLEYAWISHEVKMTIADCADIDQVLEIALCKNLFLVNKQGQYFLLLIKGDKKFVTKDVSHAIGSSRLQFAGEDKLLEYLNLTPGSITVLGLMYDKENKVQLIIDSDLLKEKYAGMHPCINTTSLRINTVDLMEKVLPALHHEPIIIEIPYSE
ncbi:MAG: prolyl-tRNA synthetase associated domain-containing protein [Clostridia bacterium]|nr:prolyl-tRNA synthetase associated domain-containing protein [Clostridia bacterium]